MSIDAMKQALEALEECTAYTSSESWSPSMTRECEAAITALRAAIEQVQGLADKVPARGTLLEQTLGKVWDEMPHPDDQNKMEQELVCVCGAIWEGQELVSTPLPRQWQELTEDDSPKTL